jgi:hypothetical protein
MKILTSIHFHKIAGITHYVLSLADYIKATFQKEEVDLIGIDIAQADIKSKKTTVNISREKNWKLYSISVPSKNITDLATEAGNLEEFELSMENVIREYEKVIAAEKPDIILLSGTYHMVWCLYVAATRKKVKKIILHCHGVIAKEVEKYEEQAKDIYRRWKKATSTITCFISFLQISRAKPQKMKYTANH